MANKNISSNNTGTIGKYWFEDMRILYDMDLYSELLPKSGMTYPQKINAVVRLSWLVGLAGMIVNFNYLYLYIPVITMLLTYILYLFRKQEYLAALKQAQMQATVNDTASKLPMGESSMDPKLVEKFADYLDIAYYNKPTADNPFMNAMPFDDRKRAPASPSIYNPVTKAEIELAYDSGTYRDVNDVWDKNNGKFLFNTMPATTYPNDQSGFANWLYRTPLTCKEGNGAQCIANIHDRTLYRRVENGIGSGGAAI
jgi:hypothetical protein